MIFRLFYNPEGGTRQEFEFDPDRVLSIESEAVEEVGGNAWSDWPEFLAKVGDGNTRARRALLWLMLRRTNDQLKFSDLVFRLDEFGIDDVEEDEPVAGKGGDSDSATALPSPPLDSEA